MLISWLRLTACQTVYTQGYVGKSDCSDRSAANHYLGGFSMHYVGIDIAKASQCCAGVGAEGSVTHKPWTFANDIVGFQKLGDFLRGIKDDLRVALEATGHYGSNLKLFLEREGFSFMECQPSLVADYIKTQTMRRTKTDNTDAVYIAGYSRSLKSEDWRPVPRGFYRTDCLKRLTRFRSSLVHQRSDSLVQITNVLDKTFPEFKPFFENRFSVTALYILAN
jgi:transposase